MHRNRGFTLVELLVYTAIFAIVAGLLTTIFYVVINTQKKTSVSGEVSQQLNLVLTTVQRLVGDASLVEAVYEGANPSSTCATFCTLKLRREDPAKDPTIISSNASGIYLQEGVSPQVTLTTNKVLINHFRLTKQEIPGGHAVVEISTSFSYNTTNPAFAVTKAIESAIARVDAATFDADLIPNQDNTFDIGQISGSNLRWKNGRFSSDLTVGGQITISGGSPGSGKVLTSDASGVGSWQVGGVGWAASSTNIYNTNSGNVGIGTAAPGYRLHAITTGTGGVKFETTDSYSDFYLDARAGDQSGALFSGDSSGNLLLQRVGGNVGIGTPSPGYPLSVTKANGVSAYFDGTTTDTSFWIAHGSVGGPSTVAGIRTNTGSPVLNAKAGGVVIFNRDVTSADVDFQYNSGASTALYIKGSTGNVGIGTAAPNEQLEVLGDIRTKAPASSGWGGTYLGLFTDYGSLPGYPANTYATLKTDGSYIGFSAAGVYSAYMNSAGTWTANSDRNKKENFVELDPQEILTKIGQLPMYQWNFKSEDPSIKHIAPVAQDFYALFGLNGNNDKMISNIDPSGVALVGIKALSEKLDALIQGTARFVHLVTDRLTVGSRDNPTGITIFDKETRDPYCLEVVNGSVKTNKGECQ